MTITSVGYKGQVQDSAFARIVANLPPTFATQTDFAPTAVANTRQVQLAVGTAHHGGVEVTNDAVLPSPVFPQPAAGQWYLAAIDRNWDPATRASSVVFLTGPTVGSAAAPAVCPTVTPVVGWYDTLGAHAVQPIAWLFVNSADTTVKIHDLRLIGTRAGAPRLATLEGIPFLPKFLRAGAIVSLVGCVAQGQTFYRGHVQITGNGFSDLADCSVSGNGTAIRNQLATMIVNAAGQLAASTNVRLVEDDTSVEWVWHTGDLVWGPPKGAILLKRWAQWNFGPAPHADWWDMPLDTWWDPYAIATYGNGMTAPVTGRYRASGRFGYQQDVNGERCIAAVFQDGGIDRWAGMPQQMYGTTGYPFQIYFDATKGNRFKFRFYHSGGGDLYMINGSNNNTTENGQVSQVLWEYLGR